jgi:hypothetical protein
MSTVHSQHWPTISKDHEQDIFPGHGHMPVISEADPRLAQSLPKGVQEAPGQSLPSLRQSATSLCRSGGSWRNPTQVVAGYRPAGGPTVARCPPEIWRTQPATQLLNATAQLETGADADGGVGVGERLAGPLAAATQSWSGKHTGPDVGDYVGEQRCEPRSEAPGQEYNRTTIVVDAATEAPVGAVVGAAHGSNRRIRVGAAVGAAGGAACPLAPKAPHERSGPETQKSTCRG